MSSQLPLRSIRIPALQRQCLFQRHQTLLRCAQPTITHPSSRRTFASTPSRPRKLSALNHDEATARSAAKAQILEQESPKLGAERAQKSPDAMVEDIGLLQNTVVRAPFSTVIGEADGIKGVFGYYWHCIKHTGTALYSRYYYRGCIQKSGWTKFLPIDLFNTSQYKALAKKRYEQIQKNFASGNIDPLEQICLPPLLKKLNQRIATRRNLHMTWRLHKYKSARIMSDRVSPLGEDHPDTCYRQVIVRLVSVQSLERSTSSSTKPRNAEPARLPWVPDAARQRAEKARQRRQKLVDEGEVEEDAVVKRGEEFLDNGVPKTVVEYLVLQRRVLRGSEEDWKVWGFTPESTPDSIKRDEAYWSSILGEQIAGGPA